MEPRRRKLISVLGLTIRRVVEPLDLPEWRRFCTQVPRASAMAWPHGQCFSCVRTPTRLISASLCQLPAFISSILGSI